MVVDPGRKAELVALNIHVPKIIFCAILVAGGLLLLRAIRGRSDELRWWRRLILALLAGRAALGIGLYLVAPQLVAYSDAVAYYLPQAQAALGGAVPYRDFATNYSPLFPYLLAPGVALWPTAGSIVATMIVAEAAMVLLYLRHVAGRGATGPGPTKTDPGRALLAHQAMFLYLIAPMSTYRVAITGYNSVLVAFFALLALILADRRRDGWAAAMAVLGLWTTKLLALITWPAVAWYRPEGRWRRTAILAGGLLLLLALPLAGIDTLQPLKAEGESYTDGNLWFPLLVFLPALHGTAFMNLAPPLCYLLAAAWVGWRHHRALAAETDRFTAASALLSSLGLLLMLLSKKSQPIYLLMVLPFLLHVLAVRGRLDRWTLAAWAWLGLTTTIHVHAAFIDEILASRQLLQGPRGWATLLGELATVASYLLLLARSLPRRGRSAERGLS